MAVGRVAGGTPPVRRRPGVPAARPGGRSGGRGGAKGREAGRAPFVVLVVLILAGGLIGLLLLNTALSQGSFQLSQLQQRTNSLTDERQGLQQQISAWSAPDALSARAAQLGMVPGGTPAFLQDNGTVLGKLTPLDGSSALPTATPSATATKIRHGRHRHTHGHTHRHRHRTGRHQADRRHHRRQRQRQRLQRHQRHQRHHATRDHRRRGAPHRAAGDQAQSQGHRHTHRPPPRPLTGRQRP
ncbi:cell division protein FtsL [Streptacidiphilus sp. PAMC 29251]